MADGCLDKSDTALRRFSPNDPWVTLDPREHLNSLVVNVTWTMKPDDSITAVIGTRIRIVDEMTTESVCVQYSYTFQKSLSKNEKWSFSMALVAEPKHIYTVTVFNLPEPDYGDYRVKKQISIPGCENRIIERFRICLENGSLWDPRISVLFTSGKPKDSVIVTFKTAQHADRYQVSIQINSFTYSKNISKENRTSVNVTLEVDSWRFGACKALVTIQPFFLRCKNHCKTAEKRFNHCKDKTPLQTLTIYLVLGLLLVVSACLAYLGFQGLHTDHSNTSPSTAEEQPQILQVQERKRVLIIYSLDHPLYKNIVLKFCAFLMTKCGTEVVLDLLDSTRLAVLGSIQWLDWHKEQIENSSDKILILCSQGVQAKWRAMCSGKRVFLREDACSLAGDMVTPFFTLMLPHFIQSVSFKKYIIAYFDEICSEEDVPSPFNVTVRYKLMKEFEEVFFRILDTEKHEPGRIKQIVGLSEDKYHECPSGRALRDALEAFQVLQREQPQWFEEELLQSSELEDGPESDDMYEYSRTMTNHLVCTMFDPVQAVNHVETEEDNFSIHEMDMHLDKKLQMCSTLEFNSNAVEHNHQLL
ncbi:interleukin-17 receptor A isoform X2 [Oryzias latipes]|uniref:Interleukin 17 receptor A2 n=1 Tax=Oryzias latipes TaxID=8090 RepID=A0A3B3ICL3_ORYLA|nr:interleukin 17 receptor A2 [Oryzias latipes]